MRGKADDPAARATAQAQALSIRTAKRLAAPAGSSGSLQSQISQLQSLLGYLQNDVSLLDSENESQAASLNAMALSIGTINANYLKRFLLPDWTVTITAGLALSLGARPYTRTLPASNGLKAGDPIFVSPKSALAAGWMIGTSQSPSDNTQEVTILNPLLAIGTYNLTLSCFTLRP